MAVAYTITPTTLSVLVNFRSIAIPSSHPNFKQLCELVKLPGTTEHDVVPLIDIPAAITSYTGGDVVVQGGKLFYRGVEVNDNLSKLILGFVKSGQPEAADPFKKFLANCRQNPDIRLVDTIFDWCVAGNMPITPEGELIAWKIVSKDWMSLRAGKRGHLRHQIGDVVSEPREECDPNRNQTCSSGIHFCSLEYLEKGGYGGGLSGGNRIIAVVINPADITAIPTDYNLSKGRCCKLRVVGEVEPSKVPGYYGSSKVYSGWTRPAIYRNAYGFAAGQTWRRRDGSTVTIKDVQSLGGYPIRDENGNSYLENGRYTSTSSTSQMDLINLITDVA